MPWRQLRLGCYPKTLYDELKQVPGFTPRTLAMDMSHEEKALEGCERDEYEPWVQLHIDREKQWHQVARHLMQRDPTDLVALLMDGVDKLQHLCWRFIDPALAATLQAPWEHRVRERCLEYFRTVDRIIADLVDLAGPEATVVIASDHGFGPQVRTLFLNQWLADQGLLAWTENRPTAGEGATLGMGSLAKHTFQMDWSKTVAYAPMPSGNGIHIVRQDEAHPNGMPAGEYEALRERIAERLLALRDPANGAPVVGNVWTREEIFAGPWFDIAPDLTLELSDGGLVSILAAEQAVTPRPEPTGTHHPLGVLVVAGPGVRDGVSLPEQQIADSASLLLYSVDAPLPADLEGDLPLDLFTDTRLAVQPPRHGDARATVDQQASTDAIFSEEDEADMMRHLQALGYLE